MILSQILPTPHSVIFNIGNNAPVRLSEYIEAIEDAVGRKAIKELLPLQLGDVPDTFGRRVRRSKRLLIIGHQHRFRKGSASSSYGIAPIMGSKGNWKATERAKYSDAPMRTKLLISSAERHMAVIRPHSKRQILIVARETWAQCAFSRI